MMTPMAFTYVSAIWITASWEGRSCDQDDRSCTLSKVARVYRNLFWRIHNWVLLPNDLFPLRKRSTLCESLETKTKTLMNFSSMTYHSFYYYRAAFADFLSRTVYKIWSGVLYKNILYKIRFISNLLRQITNLWWITVKNKKIRILT